MLQGLMGLDLGLSLPWLGLWMRTWVISSEYTQFWAVLTRIQLW